MGQEDAERPERHADAERRTIITIIFPHVLAPVAKLSDGVILRV